ncbi:MAG: 3'-5' exonuclease [Deltaproteobacteria bacterium]|nr:3'-5' exonuclease [Deltaproteobacteria bacterium]
MDRYVVFDVETTGLSPARGHRIIEIGAVALWEKEFVSEFHSLINPGRSVPKIVQEIHGIANEMLINEPLTEEVIPKFRSFLGTGVIIAHNAKFDLSFLRNEFRRLGFGLANRHLCTLDMSKKLCPDLPNYRLETVYEHLFGNFEESKVNRHRALDDARLTAEIWLELERRGALSFLNVGKK